MSKLEIFLWAATTVVFALITSTSSKPMVAIANSGEAYLKENLLRDANAVLNEEVQEFVQDIKNRYTNARPLIDALIAGSTDPNKSQCRRFFERFEQTGKEVIDNLKKLYPQALEGVIIAPENEFLGHSEELNNLNNKIFQQRDQLSRKTRSAAERSECSGKCTRTLFDHLINEKPYINGIIYKDPKYDDFCKQQQELFSKTQTCLLSTRAS